MPIAKKDIQKLNDADLQMQLHASRREYHNAINVRQSRSRGSLSDTSAALIDQMVADAARELHDVSEELAKRKAAKTFDPDRSKRPDKTVVVKSKPPAPSRKPYNPWEDEPERPPISVWDNGILRPWRKNDPIY